MAYVCDICGKTSVRGYSKKHKRGVAGKRWKHRVAVTRRLFKPNLQKKTVVINGEKRSMRLCTKCIKRIKKFGKIKSYKSISFA